MEPLIETGRVLDNAPLSRPYFLLSIRCPGIAAGIQPGQFVMAQVREGIDPLLRRPFSAHRVVRDGDGAPVGIEILIKVVGRGTRFLQTLQGGAPISLLGPLGRGFVLDGAPKRFLVVGGGCGIAPLPFAVERLIRSGNRVEIFYGAATGDELVCLDLLAGLGAPTHIATEDGSLGHKGLITDLLRRTLDLPGEQPVAILACGPVGMLRAVKEVAGACGAPCQISLETSMACGFGVCLGCAVKNTAAQPAYRLTCTEGPVFDAGAVEP